MNRQPQINEMVSFLEEQQPGIIRKLRKDNPSYENILKLGLILGDISSPDELKVRAQVCFSSLELVLKKCNEEIPRLKSLIINSKKLKFWSLIFTTISTAAVVITLTNDQYKNFAFIPGIISLIGTLVQLYAEFKTKIIDKNKTVDEIYSELVRMKIESEQYGIELNFFLNNNFNEDRVFEIINTSNQLCSDMAVLLSII